MSVNHQYYYFFILALLLVVPSCSLPGKDGQESGKELTDMFGRKVIIPEKVERIAGVGPGALRLLVYMGLSDRISGVEDFEFTSGAPYMIAQSGLTEMPSIGSRGGDSELLTLNNPDVIFMSFMSVTDADELQEKTGIPVIRLQSGNLRNARDTLYRALSLIAEVTGKHERKDSLKAFIENEIKELSKLTNENAKEFDAYIGGVSYRGSHGIASTQAFFAPFSLLNVSNVATSLVEQEPVNPTGLYVDVEQIITWDPDFLFLDAAGMKQIKPDIAPETPLRYILSAFSNENVYTLMPHNYYATNFETVLLNSWFVGKKMFPDTFEEVDFRQKAGEIFRFMLGEDIYEEMNERYDGWEKY